VLKLRNILVVRKFEVMSDTYPEIGIKIGGNYGQKYSAKVRKQAS
jgi:hypothetical protein